MLSIMQWNRFPQPQPLRHRPCQELRNPSARTSELVICGWWQLSQSRQRYIALLRIFLCALAPLLVGQGCPLFSSPDPTPGPGAGPIYKNTTDPTNRNATYLGSAACRACHANIDATQRLHGHAHMLSSVQGSVPVYPSEASRASVPTPPGTDTWNDIAFVIGGYTRKANFVNREGYLVTDAQNAPAQWDLAFAPTGQQPGFTTTPATHTGQQTYDGSCFTCHTTGARQFDASAPQFQENRPGILGTWQENGVQCEACHGPGSNHVPNPSARDIFVDTTARFCGSCHSRNGAVDAGTIPASGGYVRNYAQFNELKASGGHSNLDCTVCHDAHVSTNYSRAQAMRNDCTACHSNQNMALHGGKTFVRGDYVEQLTCVSCHMPYATLSSTPAGASVVGARGRMGDLRTHIFRINTDSVDYRGMFSADGQSVLKDAGGKAAVTVDFVCLRCHNDVGTFRLSVETASEIAGIMHQSP